MENINNISMKEWAACDRPSYKMKEHGTETMTNAELLSIIIGNGTSKENALTIARKTLNSYGNNLNDLGKASIDELKQIDGKTMKRHMCCCLIIITNSSSRSGSHKVVSLKPLWILG